MSMCPTLDRVTAAADPVGPNVWPTFSLSFPSSVHYKLGLVPLCHLRWQWWEFVISECVGKGYG